MKTSHATTALKTLGMFTFHVQKIQRMFPFSDIKINLSDFSSEFYGMRLKGNRKSFNTKILSMQKKKLM